MDTHHRYSSAQPNYNPNELYNDAHQTHSFQPQRHPSQHGIPDLEYSASSAYFPSADSLLKLEHAPTTPDKNSEYPPKLSQDHPPTRLPPRSRKTLIAPSLLMISSVLMGLIFAVGHHAYYNSLNNKSVDITSVVVGQKVFGQGRAIQAGNALAYAVKFFFGIAIGTAYVQRLWLSAQRPNGLSVEGLDAGFDLLKDPRRFFSSDLISSAFVLVSVGFVSWGVPNVAIFTPGALSVRAQNITSTSACTIPSVDLSSPSAPATVSLFDFGVTQATSGVSDASGYMQRVASQSLLAGQYAPPQSPCGSVCSYTVPVTAPYFKCVNGSSLPMTYYHSPLPTEIIYYNATYDQSPLDGNGNPQDAFNIYWTSSAIYPNDAVVICSAINATYTFKVSHNGGNHDVEIESLVENGSFGSGITGGLGQFSGTDPSVLDPAKRSQLSFMGVTTAIRVSLEGTISSTERNGVSFFETTGTTLAAFSNFADLTASQFTAVDNIAGMMQSYLFNVTIGLMAWNTSSTLSTATYDTTCTTFTSQNVFSYQTSTLFIPYAAGFAATLLVVFVGLHALWSNQFNGDTAFGTLLGATRNPTLDALVVPGRELDEKHWSKVAGEGGVRLRFGVVNDRGSMRMAFGRVGEYFY